MSCFAVDGAKCNESDSAALLEDSYSEMLHSNELKSLSFLR